MIYFAQFNLQCGVTRDECGSVSPGGLSAAALVSTFTKPNIQCPATGSYGWRWKCGETTPDPPVGNPLTTGVRLYSLLILSTRLFGDKELLAQQDGISDKLPVATCQLMVPDQLLLPIASSNTTLAAFAPTVFQHVRQRRPWWPRW